METIKVSSKSNPNSVAGALANVFREKGVVEVQAIGAGALNQAIKGVAIARGFVAPSGKNLVCTPAFIDINIEGEERTAIKLIVEAKQSLFLLSKYILYIFTSKNISKNIFKITKNNDTINIIIILYLENIKYIRRCFMERIDKIISSQTNYSRKDVKELIRKKR